MNHEFSDLPEEVQEQITKSVAESITKAASIGEQIFGILSDASQDKRWDPDSAVYQYDDDELEMITNLGNELGQAITRGDYNSFAASLALIMASTRFPDQSRSKWDLFPVIVRNTWRAARDAMKEEMSANVDDFLKEIFGEET